MANIQDVSVVLCALNEEHTIGQVILDLQCYLPAAEVIVVDNGSTDDTALEALRFGARVVTEWELGKGRAMRAGARAATRDYILFHDADGEYSVEDCAAVVKSTTAESWGLGVRLASYSEIFYSSWLANKLIGQLLYARTGVRIPDILSGTRCIPRQLFLELNTHSKGFAIETELTRKLVTLGKCPSLSGVRFCPRTKAEGKKIRAFDLLYLVYEALRR